MRTSRLLFGALGSAALIGLTSLTALAQTPYAFASQPNPLVENFTTISTWNNNFATPAPAYFAPVTAAAGTGIGTGNNPTTTTTTVFSSGATGGVQKGTNNIALLATGGGTGNTNAAAFDLLLNFTGIGANVPDSLKFTAAELDNGIISGTNAGRGGTLRVYTSNNGTTFTQLGSDISVFNGTPSTQNFAVSLASAGFTGSATARVRFYYFNANIGTGLNTGSRPKITIDNLRVSIAAPSATPSLSTSAGKLYFVETKGVTSAVQSFSVTGSNLTSDPTVTLPGGTNFEISQTSAVAGFGTGPLTLTRSGSSVSATIWVRFNSATAGTNNENLTVAGGGASSKTVVLRGKALAIEPTVQPTVDTTTVGFTSASFTVAGGNGAKRLLVLRMTNFPAFRPADSVSYTGLVTTTFGTGTAVGTLTYIVLDGTATTVTVNGLTANSVYQAGVFAYNDDNVAGSANYLNPSALLPPVLVNGITFTTDVPPPNTYLWTGPANGSYTLPANWTSQAGSAVGAGQPRTTPAPEDILRFPNGTSTVLVDLTANEQIGGLLLGNTADVTLTLNGATDRTITIGGVVSGDDFTVPNAARLAFRNNASGGGLKLTMLTPSAGTVAGTIDFDGTAPSNTADHVLTGVGLTFTSGSQFLIGTRTSGTALAGVATMQNGSTMEQKSGSTVATTVIWQPSATYIWDQNSTLGVSNRSYGNLTIRNHASGTSTGAGTLSVNNLTIDGTATLSLGLTGTYTIAGDIITTSTGSVRFIPASNTSLVFTNATPEINNSLASAVTFANITLSAPNLAGGEVMAGYIATNTAAGNLTLSAPVRVMGALTLNAGNVVSGGNLIINSDNSTTAYIRNAGAGVVTGNASVERAVDGLSGTAGVGYRHYSSPVSGSTVADLATASFTPIVDPAFNTAPNPLSIFTPATYPNVFGYDPARVNANNNVGFTRGYFSPNALTDALVVGKGYSVRKNTSTVDFVGTPNTGNVNLTLTGNGTLGAAFYGWNLLGNPYPSGLNWNLVTVPAGVSTVAAVYVPDGATNGHYNYYDRSPGADFVELPMAQGFFLRKTNSAASATVTLTNSNRVAGSGQNFNRAASVTTIPTLRLTIANAATPAVKPMMAIYFEAGATAGIDDVDGVAPTRSQGTVPTLLSLIGGVEAGVNRLPELTGADVVVPVLVATPTTGSYVIDARSLANFPAGTQVLLTDAVTGTTQDLALNGTYTFRSTANYAGQRFSIRFTANRVTGTAADLLASALSVYPNPAAGSVRVSAAANATVRVIDALGREVRSVKIDATAAERTISLDGLTPGVYTVKAGTAAQKLVVE